MDLVSRLEAVLSRVEEHATRTVDTSRYELHFRPDAETDTLVCALAPRGRVPADQRLAMAVAIMRSTCEWGGFALDPTDGALHFRLGVRNASSQLNDALVRGIIANAVRETNDLLGYETPAYVSDEVRAVSETAMLDVAKAALASLGLEFEETEDGLVWSMQSQQGKHVAVLTVNGAAGTLYCNLSYPMQPPFRFAEPLRPRAAQFLCAANCTFDVGALQLELDTGVSSFSHSLRLFGHRLSQAMVRDLINYCWLTAHEFHHLFQAEKQQRRKS